MGIINTLVIRDLKEYKSELIRSQGKLQPFL